MFIILLLFKVLQKFGKGGESGAIIKGCERRSTVLWPGTTHKGGSHHLIPPTKERVWLPNAWACESAEASLFAIEFAVTSVRILNWWNYGESWVPARRSMRKGTKSGLWTVDCGLDHRHNNGFNSGQNSDSLDQTSHALQRFDVMLLSWIIIPVSANIDQLWLANSAAYRSFIWRGSKVMSALLVDVVP